MAQYSLFAFPVAATSILEQLSNLIATVIIGNFGRQGTLAMAAVGSNVPLTSLMLNLFIGMSLGSNVVIANAIGRNDQNMVKRAVHTSILMALVGFVVIALGEIFAEPMLAALNVPAETMPLASLYLRVFLLSMPLDLALYNFEAAIFRSVGITSHAAAGACRVHRPQHWLGPHLCPCTPLVSRASLSPPPSLTPSAPLRSLSAYSRPTRRPRHPTRLLSTRRPQAHRQDRPARRASKAPSLPSPTSSSSLPSTAWHRGHGGIERRHEPEYVCYNLLNSFSRACTTFVGQNHGARQIDRCTKTLQGLPVEGGIVALTTIIVIVGLGREILSLFNSDPNIVSIGYIRVCSIFPAYAFSMFYENMSGYLRGFGISLTPALITMICVCGIRFYCVLRVPAFPHLCEHHDGLPHQPGHHGVLYGRGGTTFCHPARTYRATQAKATAR